MTKNSSCSWCRGIDTDDDTGLCRMHLAEHAGLSLNELDRMEAEELADQL